MAKKFDDVDTGSEAAEPGEYGLENRSDMPKEQQDPSWIQGFVGSDPKDADAPNYPGNQVWSGPGSSAETYKAHWKNKPKIFPYGTNNDGGV